MVHSTGLAICWESKPIISSFENVTIEIDDIIEFELFPNPANGFIEILYDLDVSQNLNWDLFDAKGKQIEVISSKNYKSGRNSINLDIKDLKRGMYFIKIQSHKKLLSRAFIKN